ncbi:MAG: alpha/beta fold hydrolase [Leptospiraceae bacterium]|nr:alpha/beta fold hydrolase [Leptospiraceae bacterium]
MKGAHIAGVGSRIIHIADSHNNIDFPAWLLYPSTQTPIDTHIGPFPISVCPEGPIAEGQFPLVIISHGGGGSHLLYRTIALHLAGNGFFVAMPEHYGNNRTDNSLGDTDRNIALRTHHISLLIDELLNATDGPSGSRLGLIGHSMGGATALALAGAKPWSRQRLPIPVTSDNRIAALVLLAPATAWFQHPDSFEEITVPILAYRAQHDSITPRWQTELLVEKKKVGPVPIIREVPGAGHLSFLAPYPESMKRPDFPPSQDPSGFDRVTFHETLKSEILEFLSELL